MSDLEFWLFLAVAVPALFLPVAIVRWKGRAIGPVALLSLVFWPGALLLALRMARGRPRHGSISTPADGIRSPPTGPAGRDRALRR